MLLELFKKIFSWHCSVGRGEPVIKVHYGTRMTLHTYSKYVKNNKKLVLPKIK